MVLGCKASVGLLLHGDCDKNGDFSLVLSYVICLVISNVLGGKIADFLRSLLDIKMKLISNVFSLCIH